MKQYILFDLDGTLTDPGEGITNSVAYALEKYGIHEPDHTVLYPFIGPPLVQSFVTRYGFTEAQGLQAVTYYREYFKEKGIFENRVYDGIPELLSALKQQGKTLILATSKPEAFAVRILEHFDLMQYFDYAFGATMDQSRTAKADVIRYALESAGITDLDQAVMVGDRLHDIEGAKANSLDSIGVLYGYGDRQELEEAGADLIAPQLNPELFERL